MHNSFYFYLLSLPYDSIIVCPASNTMKGNENENVHCSGYLCGCFLHLSFPLLLLCLFNGSACIPSHHGKITLTMLGELW